jgi:hypothetical protein
VGASKVSLIETSTAGTSSRSIEITRALARAKPNPAPPREPAAEIARARAQGAIGTELGSKIRGFKVENERTRARRFHLVTGRVTVAEDTERWLEQQRRGEIENFTADS